MRRVGIAELRVKYRRRVCARMLPVSGVNVNSETRVICHPVFSSSCRRRRRRGPSRVAPRKNTSLSTTVQTRDCGDSAPDPLRPTSPANIEATSKSRPRKMKTKLERERNNTIASQSPCFESSSWVVPTLDHDRHHDRRVNRQKQRSPFVAEFDAVKREEERNLLRVVLPEGRCKETK